MPFELATPFSPMGDQPAAIEAIANRVEEGAKHQVLLGVTGSGKTFTMANVIAKTQRPTLVMAPNKTLAAQLFQELREFFPNNAVQYFISYYDYYQPEAYVPSSDTYIAKDSAINDDIDKMRHAATMSLLERRDTIIVASVSCIYGLGSPDIYAELMVRLERGQQLDRDDFLRSLIEVQYSRNDTALIRGAFRVRGDVVDILPAHQKDEAIRIEFFGDEVERILLIDSLKGDELREVDTVAIYPKSHYVAAKRSRADIVRDILADLGTQLRLFKSQNKLLEFQRLEQRTMADVEAIEQLGFCPGIENYSRYLNNLPAGAPPPSLLDYFPKDFLTIIDESHITVSQVGGMFRGDRARKQVLVDHGFRLPSALDNRPLNFEEFLQRNNQIVYVSATPNPFEMQQSGQHYAEQIIRPTGLIDPEIEVRPVKGQVDDLYAQLKQAIKAGGRALITTLTKKMAEDLTQYYQELGLKVSYLHSEVDSLERIEILRDLRRGVFDVLIGINLLREGLDLPEVRLVAVLDADKEGFLRSRTSLIQIVGRAARNADGRVVFYADKITEAMKGCIEETQRRRDLQLAYNKEHGITPQTIQKAVPEDMRKIYGMESDDSLTGPSAAEKARALKAEDPKKLDALIRKKDKEMRKAASELEFEKAAQLRDEIRELKELLFARDALP